jgi:dipeptidyl aminopeptidase/acylaminoacyl peptidase
MCREDTVMKMAMSVLALAVAMPMAFGAEAAPATVDQDTSARLLAKDFTEPVLSADGKWVAYVRRTASFEENGYRYAAVLKRADGKGMEEVLAQSAVVTSMYAGAFLSWSPSKSELAFRVPGTQMQVIDAETRDRRTLELPSSAERLFQAGIASGFAWSPDGARIAFTAPAVAAGESGGAAAKVPPSEGTTGVELDIYWDPARSIQMGRELRTLPQRAASLWVMDLQSQRIERLTNDDLDVLTYAWSPNGRQIAIGATQTSAPPGALGQSDLYVVDVASKARRTLVHDRGDDASPTWSADGRWIAYTSQVPFTTDERPENARFETTLAVVSADGRSASRDLLGTFHESAYVPLNVHGIRWAENGKNVMFAGGAELRSALYQASLDGKSVSIVTPRTGLEDFQQCDMGPAAAVSARRIVCVRQAATVPPAVVLSEDGGKSWRVLDEDAQSAAVFRGLSSEIVSWRSADERWDVHGILIKPASFDAHKRYPLMVFLEGGPSMTRAVFGVSSQYPLLEWAHRGFIVLSANTRGRSGYGYAFAAAIADEHSERIVPQGDVTSGVDYLVKRGLADPRRVGIVGFSYGFALGLETIAQSSLFRAASLGDGAVENLTFAFEQVALPWHRFVLRDQNGAGSVFDPVSLKTLMDESTLFRLQQIKTPVLAEFGASHTLLAKEGRMLLHALTARGVPVELIAYPRTGHGVNEPLLRLDSTRRNIEWFDYWVLDQGDARMKARFGE